MVIVVVVVVCEVVVALTRRRRRMGEVPEVRGSCLKCLYCYVHVSFSTHLLCVYTDE